MPALARDIRAERVACGLAYSAQNERFARAHRAKLIERAARGLIGTPGKPGGRVSLSERLGDDMIDPATVGLDAAGVILKVGAALGLDLTEPDDWLLDRWLAANFTPAPQRQIAPGDVVGIRHRSQQFTDHVAVVTSSATLVHSYHARPFPRGPFGAQGAVTETHIAPLWLDRIVSVWTFPNCGAA